MIDYLEYLNVPTKIGLVIIAAWFVIQIVGELLELKGKVVPEWMKIRKYFARRKSERENAQRMMELMENIGKVFNEVNEHYSTDNIKMRDDWIKGVNAKLENHDQNMQVIAEKLDKSNRDILALLIESKRSTIIDFASYVINENAPVTREQFNRIFKLYQEYEAIIEANNMSNGEVDVAIRIIKESYENHMRSHTFVEYQRGYDDPFSEMR